MSWSDAAAYDAFMGRYSGPLAPLFADLAEISSGQEVLDVGCGTGALSSVIAARCEPAAVLGVDPSEAYVAWAAAHVEDCRVRFAVADATHLPAGPFDDQPAKFAELPKDTRISPPFCSTL